MSDVALKTTDSSKNSQFKDCTIDGGADVSGEGNKFVNSSFIERGKKLASDSLADTIQKLGTLGIISFIMANYALKILPSVNFETEPIKGAYLSFLAAAFLLFTGWIYKLKVKEESSRVVAALEVLKEIYNRLAEQTGKTDKDQTVSITMTIDNLPQKIAEVIKNTVDQSR